MRSAAHPAVVGLFAMTLSVVAILESAEGQAIERTRAATDDLAARAVEWRTLDPETGDLSDLGAVADSLRSARIVVLGETHKDGASAWLKTRIVRLLHERLGFDVLAWESPFFDLWELRARLPRMRDGAELRSAHGIAPVWTKAETTAPLLRYIVESQRTERPLELFGLDCKFGAIGRDATLGLEAIDEDLGPFLRRITAAFGDGGTAIAPQIAAIERMVNRLDASGGVSTEAERAGDRAALDACASAVSAERSRLVAAHGITTAAVLDHVLRGLRAQSEWYARMTDESEVAGAASFTNPRDEFMVESLHWYFDHVAPDAKVIVWTGGFHGLAEPGVVEFESDVEPSGVERRFSGMESLAKLCRRDWNADVRVVGCTSWRGETGNATGASTVLAGAHAGSLEAALDTTMCDVGWIDVAALPADHPFRRMQWCAASSHGPARAPWPRVLDGIAFSRSTFLASARSPSRSAGERDRLVVDGMNPRANVVASRLVVDEPLETRLEVASPAAVELSQGCDGVGALVLHADSTLTVTGDLKGDVVAFGSIVGNVTGATSGTIHCRGRSRWSFNGPLRGVLRLTGPAIVAGIADPDPTSAASIVTRGSGVVIVLRGHTPRSWLGRIHGAARIELESSDIPAGAQRIGELDVVVERSQ